jgi:hypothetical protein
MDLFSAQRLVGEDAIQIDIRTIQIIGLYQTITTCGKTKDYGTIESA